MWKFGSNLAHGSTHQSCKSLESQRASREGGSYGLHPVCFWCHLTGSSFAKFQVSATVCKSCVALQGTQAAYWNRNIYQMTTVSEFVVVGKSGMTSSSLDTLLERLSLRLGGRHNVIIGTNLPSKFFQATTIPAQQTLDMMHP